MSTNSYIIEAGESLYNKINEIRKKYPYDINVIDELHINENAHSRILCKILKYKNENGKYEFLTYLIKYIIKNCKKDSFKDIVVRNPTITQEEGRIDLWIRDDNYAIIIENKFYNATDQAEQISRYINKTIKDSSGNYINGDNIFVIYLSQSGQEPESQSWGNYKEAFCNRYVNLSFKTDMLDWLKNYVLPNVKYKEEFLRCSIFEYIDYIEGFFNLRERDKKMGNEIHKEILKACGISDSSDRKDCVKKLQEEINKLNEAISDINQLKEKYRLEIFSKWIEEFTQEFESEFDKDPHYIARLRFKVPSEKNIIVYLQDHQHYGGEYGVLLEVELEPWSKIKGTLIEKLEEKGWIKRKVSLGEGQWQGNDSCIWKFFDYNDFDNIKESFLKIGEAIRRLINGEGLDWN